MFDSLTKTSQIYQGRILYQGYCQVKKRRLIKLIKGNKFILGHRESSSLMMVTWLQLALILIRGTFGGINDATTSTLVWLSWAVSAGTISLETTCDMYLLVSVVASDWHYYGGSLYVLRFTNLHRGLVTELSCLAVDEHGFRPSSSARCQRQEARAMPPTPAECQETPRSFVISLITASRVTVHRKEASVADLSKTRIPESKHLLANSAETFRLLPQTK